MNLPIDISGERIQPGEAYLGETPVLGAHAGTQPDLFLRWNEIPVSAGAIDVPCICTGSRNRAARCRSPKR